MTVDIESELSNWVRTVRVGKVRHHCGSAEGGFRPPLGEVQLLDEAVEARVPVDVRRGWRVELAWRALPSIRTRLLLSWHYVRNRSLQESARKAKIEQRKAEHELARGRAHIHQILLISRFR